MAIAFGSDHENVATWNDRPRLKDPMEEAPFSHEDFARGAPRPRREHRLPRLSWARLLRPGVSGKKILALFFATLLMLLAAVLLIGSQ
jgi:hypothetical protein